MRPQYINLSMNKVVMAYLVLNSLILFSSNFASRFHKNKTSSSHFHRYIHECHTFWHYESRLSINITLN